MYKLWAEGNITTVSNIATLQLKANCDVVKKKPKMMQKRVFS